MSKADSHPDDQAPTPLEVSRRDFMARATVGMGTVMGLGLVIPIGGSVLPNVGAGGASWSALDEAGWRHLQDADGAVQIDFSFNGKDAYLPTQTVRQSAWGIKVKDMQKFMRDRADLFAADGKSKLPYEFLATGFVLFSPLCPHLNCPYGYDMAVKRFICTCHGSQYDQSGAHVAGPATRGLDPLPLREQSGIAQVQWIRYQATTPDRIVISYIG
jgi:Rieske Fe-S protein